MSRLVASSAVVLVAVAGACSSPPAAKLELKEPARPLREGSVLLLADIGGVLKPCGCTAALRKGGFDRLQPLLAKRRKAAGGAPVAHAGPLFHSEGAMDPRRDAQWTEQSRVAADLIRITGIDVSNVAALDLTRGADRLRALAKVARVSLTSVNVSLAGDEDAVRPFVIKAHGSLLFGLLGVTARPKGGLPAGVTWREPIAAAREGLEALRGRSVDIVVLLSDLGLAGTRALVSQVPGFDFAVVGGQGKEGHLFADSLETAGGARLIQMHREGRYLGQLTVRASGDGPSTLADRSPPGRVAVNTIELRARRLRAVASEWVRSPTDPKRGAATRHVLRLLVEEAGAMEAELQRDARRPHFAYSAESIDWDYPQNHALAKRMKAFDKRLARINCENAPAPPPPGEGVTAFVGVEKCLECHEETAEPWRKTSHHSALKTLQDDDKTCDLECVSCHVTGFERPGGAFLGHLEGRGNVQCESCHGPGSGHVAMAEEGEAKAKLFPAPFLRAPGEAVCVTCHNREHDKNFDFIRDRKKILMPGHDFVQRKDGR